VLPSRFSTLKKALSLTMSQLWMTMISLCLREAGVQQTRLIPSFAGLPLNDGQRKEQCEPEFFLLREWVRPV